MKTLVQRIITGDSSKVLPVLIDKGELGKYNLCVSSPPYWDLVQYNSGNGDLSMIKKESEFEEKMIHITKCLSRLLEPRGTLVYQWEDKTSRHDGRTGEYMLSSINNAVEKAGMVLYARWIWKKFVKKDSVMYSTYDMAQSGLARPNPNWSYVFAYKHERDNDMNPHKSEITRDEWAQWADGVWDFSNPGVKHHNTPFAPELVDRILKLYTAPGDSVIEPFLGSGTTMKECIELGRACTGIELNPGYVDKIKDYVDWGRQSFAYKYEYKHEVIQ